MFSICYVNQNKKKRCLYRREKIYLTILFLENLNLCFLMLIVYVVIIDELP